MPTSTLTTKGQITLPKEVRNLLGVAPGDQLDFVIGQDGSVRVVPLSRPVHELFGMLAIRGRRPASATTIDDSIVSAIAEDDERIRSGG
jgi:antitoxin PrlF